MSRGRVVVSDPAIRAVTVSRPLADVEAAPTSALDPLDLVPPVMEATPAADLEHRVEVLEQTVVRLQDTQALEERVVQRVLKRLPAAAGTAAPSWLSKLNPFRAAEAVSLPVAS